MYLIYHRLWGASGGHLVTFKDFIPSLVLGAVLNDADDIEVKLKNIFAF